MFATEAKRKIDYNMPRLDSKIAIVTGRASGIGLATAERLSQEGAGVAVLTNQLERKYDICRVHIRHVHIVG